MPKIGFAMKITSLSNYACLYTADFQSHGMSTAIYHIYIMFSCIQHFIWKWQLIFKMVTETGTSLKTGTPIKGKVLIELYYNF